MYSAFKEFYNLLSQLNSVYHDAALKLGLTDSELDILYSLNEHGSGCNQSIFYKETGTTKSTINSAVRKMEQAGYLYLKPGTGRNTCVFLTEKGEELMKNTAHRLIAIENAIFESWSPEEQQLRAESPVPGHKILEQGVPVLMTNFSRILNALSGLYSEEKNQYIDSLNQYSLLIIDDLGIERSTEFALEQVFNVIDSRYRSKLPLIVTTNMTLEELKNPQDLTRSRIYDRVLERCVPLRINNQNIRQRNAAESMKEARKILESGTGT